MKKYCSLCNKPATTRLIFKRNWWLVAHSYSCRRHELAVQRLIFKKNPNSPIEAEEVR